MKLLRPILIIFVIFLLAGSSLSQRKFGGRVIDVVDGKTVVIEMESGRLTAVLQFIEIPEREQPLYWTVRNHLEKLVLGKTVEFNPQGILPAKTFGQLYVGAVDVAEQMLRDGAAWHVGANQSGQNKEEFSAYQFNQEQARAEKRGVWGVDGLKPAWEFRAERKESEKRQEKAFEPAAAEIRRSAVEPGSTKRAAEKKSGYWGDTNPSLKNVGALLHGYNAESKRGYIGTSLLGVAELEKEKDLNGQKTAVDITYFYKEDDRKGRTGVFVVSVISLANEWRFLKGNDLVVVADEKSTLIGKPKRTTFKEGDLVGEKLIYEVSRGAIERFINGADVVIKVGDYSMCPQPGLQLLLYNLLRVSE